LIRDINFSIIELNFTVDMENEIAEFKATRQQDNFRKLLQPSSSSSTSGGGLGIRETSEEIGGSETSKAKVIKVEVIFSFDTTGSMGKSVVQEVKEKIIELITKELFKKLTSKNLRIGLIAHGDYCDPKDVIFQTFPLSDHPETVIDWIRSIQTGSGGDLPEKY
jgi:hypothetical protein